MFNSISRSGFTNRLERHIDDYYKGKGNLSKDVSAELSRMNYSAASSLSPKAKLSYIGYTTAFNYGHRARMINAVDSMEKTLEKIA